MSIIVSSLIKYSFSMCEKFGVDDKTRFLVLYYDAQMNVLEISKIIHRSTQVIHLWENRIKKGEDIRVAKKRKIKKSITEETENRIIQMVKENPQGSSLKKIAARIGGISTTSIYKILARKGFKYKAFDKGIIYTEEERINRVAFCKKMLAEEGKVIYQTFFSDEMSIELNNVYKMKAWQLATENIRMKKATEYVKLHCWGAISAQGATSLEIYEKSLNGTLYQEIIKRHKAEMEKIYPDGDFYFMQDHHPAHQKSKEWVVKEQNLKLLNYPKRSPDLNIIENLWSALKERVVSEGPANEKELRASLLSNWALLTKTDRLEPFFEGLHRRYMLCIEKEGHKFRY